MLPSNSLIFIHFVEIIQIKNGTGIKQPPAIVYVCQQSFNLRALALPKILFAE